MKLTINNFKGIAQGTYSFPERGVVRLEGDNGSGKTSILMAIVWCLCGKVPRNRSLAKRGSKTFSVVIEDFAGLSIKRTNSPSKLIVTSPDGVYEDREAEEVISQVLGCDPHRAAWGLLQTATSSLIGLAPSEQYQVLSEISGVDLEDVKARVNATQDASSTYVAKASAYEIDLAKYETTEAKLLKDLEGLPQGASDHEKAEKNKALIESKRRLLGQLETKLASIEGQGPSEAVAIQAEIDEILKIRKGRCPQADVDSIRATYEGYKALLIALQSRDEHISYVRETTAENFQRISEIETKLRKIDPDLRDQVSQLRDDHRDYEKKLSVYESLLETKSRAQETMKAIFTSIKREYADEALVVQAKTPKTMIAALTSLKKTYLAVMDCPSCGACLVESERTLEEAPEGAAGEGDVAKAKKISSLIDSIHPKLVSDFQMKIIHPGNPPSSLEPLEKKLADYETLRGELRSLNIGADPMARRLEIKAKKGKDLVAALGPDWLEELDSLDVEGCSSYLADLGSDLEQAVSAWARYEDQHARYEAAQKRLKDLQSRLAEVSSSEDPLKISMRITALTNEIASLVRAVSTDEARKRRESLEAELTKVRANSELITNDLESVRELIKGLAEVKKLIKTAALMTFEQTLDAINASAAVHIEKFFGPSTRVALVLPRETKGKTDLEVFHNSEESSYENFSGGEAQKVRLAFFLAVSEVLGLRLMLVDEAISSVDESSKGLVLDAIASAAHAPLRLVVAHSEELAFDASVAL